MTGPAAPQRPDAWAEGRDGTRVSYRERLVPPASWWLLSLAMAGSLGVAYGHFLGPLTGVVTFAVAQACLAWVLWFRAAPAIRVDDRVFRAGPARLPIPFIGEVRVLDEAATRGLRGPAGEASAYFCVRPAVASRAVAVVVADPADPHPYWLVSSRRPDELATALARAVADRATM